MMLRKCCTQYAANLENSAVATGLEVSFHSNPKERQCKEIEENNRMGKTRDLFKKIRDTKGTLHAKMGSIKGQMVNALVFAKPNTVSVAFYSSISLFYLLCSEKCMYSVLKNVHIVF